MGFIHRTAMMHLLAIILCILLISTPLAAAAGPDGVQVAQKVYDRDDGKDNRILKTETVKINPSMSSV